MKKILNIFLTVIMIGLIILLCINLSIKKMSSKAVTNAVVIQETSGRIKEVLNESFPEVSNAVINQVEDVIKDNSVLNNITGNLIDQISESINNGSTVATDDIMEQLSKAIDESIPKLEETIGKKIPQEKVNKIQSQLTDKDSTLQNKITSAVEKIQSATPKTKEFIKTYSMLNDTLTRVICIVGIIIITVLLGIVNKSYFKWTLFNGIASLVSGVIIGLFLPFAVSTMEYTIGMKLLGMSIDIPVGSLQMSGLICGLLGIILVVVYIILNHKYPTYDRHYYYD